MLDCIFMASSVKSLAPRSTVWLICTAMPLMSPAVGAPVEMGFSDGEELQDHRFAGLDFGRDFLAGLQAIEESGRWQNADVSVCLAELVIFQRDGLFSARGNGNAASDGRRGDPRGSRWPRCGGR